VRRSVKLMHAFLAASAVILLAGALALGWFLTSTLKTQAVRDARTSLTQYVDGVLRPRLVHGNRLRIERQLSTTILAELRHRSDLISVKVWRADGTLAWTNRDPSRIGTRFKLADDLGASIRENRAVGSIGKLSPGGEHAVEALVARHDVLEVYAPLESQDGTRAIGAYELYANPAQLEGFIASRMHMIWLVLAGVFSMLYLALALLVRGASRTLHNQTIALETRSQELLESNSLLERSAFETIESLNATVDAKDPYTAGHSLRVQRIALAIGEQLGFSAESLDALRYAGLFHDIGKIAVPDAILAKPAALTDDEWELIKRHPAHGAEIVGRLGWLRHAVPLIRHHHERWDGNGYPDRLAGDAIPLEAAVVGLADAWDAMTTDRPYRSALGDVEATLEIRRGRGTQFAPAVVDAFFAAVAARPDDFSSVPPHVSALIAS
jgi:putative nucleotidyltransferase with HDIG domain